MQLPAEVLAQVELLLTEYIGTPVRIVGTEAVGGGWSGQFSTYPWVTRCILESDSQVVPHSVIVKQPRPSNNPHNSPDLFYRERTALKFLTSIGSTIAPQFFAADDEAGLLIMEDLGEYPNLEDLLTSNDPAQAEAGLVEFAAALGRLHVVMHGQAERYYQLLSRFGPVDPITDRTSILRVDIKKAWQQLQEIVSSRPHLPAPNESVAAEVEQLLAILTEPGPYLALSNGDPCPCNCRITPQGLRLLDFEVAAFRHALLDVAVLRLPFPACGCWSNLPLEVGQRAEAAYRRELAAVCPEVLDDTSYLPGLGAACAAWTIIRAVRLPKLEIVDTPQPMGFSRRGQLLDTLNATAKCLQSSGTLPALAEWLRALEAALRTRWPEVAPRQPLYPAFQ